MNRGRVESLVFAVGCSTLAGTFVWSAGCQRTAQGRWEPKVRLWNRTESARGEPWTILCLETYGPEGRASVKLLAEALRRMPALKADRVRVISEEDTNRLFYGTYHRVYDADHGDWRFPPELRRDMSYIRQLSVADTYPFLHSIPVLLDQGPVGPPAWDLARASKDYTLLVAVYSDIEGRREAAVEHVKLLREQGEEAFYYHDASKSHVCVGLFSDADLKKTPRGVPLIVHPEYVAARRRHPHFIFNGQYISNVNRDGEGNVVSKTRQPTRLVRIPKDGSDGLR